jgi:hypothetical protein
MARRRLLGDDLWARHLEPPADEREIARHFTLTRDDLLAIASKRTNPTRLGYALLLLYLRCPVSMLNEVSAKRLDKKSPLGLYLATSGAAP